MNPLLEAVQAVLGAVLLDPGQLRQLGWLAPDHFHRPVHQALFAALRQLHADGHPASAAETSVPLSWVTDAVAEAGLHVRGVTASYAHSLISACPRPGHAPVYGRMVLEGAIHRSVTAHAIRLHQAARADARQGDVEGTLRRADVLRDVLNDLARRWGTEPRPVATGTPPAPGPLTPPPSWANQVAEDEQTLLSVLAERPKSMDEVVDWLRPDDFADPTRGEVYRCLGALHHRGAPIDRITLLWEAQRRGLLADGTLSRGVRRQPPGDAVEQLRQRLADVPAELGQPVGDLGRRRLLDLPPDQAVLDQRAQGLGEHLLADAVDALAQLVEPEVVAPQGDQHPDAPPAGHMVDHISRGAVGVKHVIPLPRLGLSVLHAFRHVMSLLQGTSLRIVSQRS